MNSQIFAFNLNETEAAIKASTAKTGLPHHRTRATVALIAHVMNLGIEMGVTKLSASGKNTVFIQPVNGRSDLSGQLFQAMGQIKNSPLAALYTELASKPIAETLPEFAGTEAALKGQATRKAKAAAADRVEKATRAVEQAKLEDLLDRAYLQAKKGTLPSEELQKGVQAYGTPAQQKRLSGITGFAQRMAAELASKAQQVSAPRVATPAPAATERKAPNPRHLYLARETPALDTPMLVNGKAVVYYELGKVWRSDESTPSVYGYQFLGHEGEYVRFAYYREATPEEAQQVAAQQEAERAAELQQVQFSRNLKVLFAEIRTEGKTQADDQILWETSSLSYWDRISLRLQDDGKTLVGTRYEFTFADSPEYSVRMVPVADLSEAARVALQFITEHARVDGRFRRAALI